MSKLNVVVEEDTVELSFCVPTKLCTRILSFLLAGLVTLLGTIGFKIELNLKRTDEPVEVTHDIIS